MKQLLSIFFLIICTINVQSQNNVFILVDVSKSVTQAQLTDAKQALNEVLTGSPLTKASVAQGSPQDLVKFRLEQGDKLSIVKFGNLRTTLGINPNPTQVQNISVDASQILNTLSWMPTDNQTYITLAKAKIAEYAKNNQLTKYKLYVISDNVNDDYGQGGRPSYPDDYTRNLAEGYNTSTNQVIEAGYTKIKFAANSLFTLSFSPNVDVSKYSLPGGSVTPPPSNTPTITLTSFVNGKKEKPKPANSNSFTVSWNCDCPVGTLYNVSLTESNGSKYKDLKKNLSANSIKFSDVPSGTFKIIVSAPNATSAITYVETPSGSFGWVILFLLLAGLIGLSIYYFNKKRQEKMKKVPIDENLFGTNNNSNNQTGSF